MWTHRVIDWIYRWHLRCVYLALVEFHPTPYIAHYHGRAAAIVYVTYGKRAAQITIYAIVFAGMIVGMLYVVSM
jgi:hypothetical protein